MVHQAPAGTESKRRTPKDDNRNNAEQRPQEIRRVGCAPGGEQRIGKNVKHDANIELKAEMANQKIDSR